MQKVNEINKQLTQITREKSQINKATDKKETITMDITLIKQNQRSDYKQLYVNKSENLQKRVGFWTQTTYQN